MTSPIPEFPVVVYDQHEAAIAELREQVMPLEIRGLADDQGRKAVHKARMIVKGTRVDIEKRRKALKDPALEYGRLVDARAKELTGLLEPIEQHLIDQEAAVKREEAELAAKEERERKAALDERMKQLREAGSPLPPSAVEPMQDVEFQKALGDAQELGRQRAEAEAAEKAEREAKAKAEREERLRAERAVQAEREALEAQRKEQAAKEKALADERRKLEAEKAAIPPKTLSGRQLDPQDPAWQTPQEPAPEGALPSYEELTELLAGTVEDLVVPSVPWGDNLRAALSDCAARIRFFCPAPAADTFADDDFPWS